MNKLAVLAMLSAGIAASHPVPTFAQAPRWLFPRPRQSNNVNRPNPRFAPPVLPPRTRVTVDSSGNRAVVVETPVSEWNPRRGTWTVRTTQQIQSNGTNPFAQPAAQGTKNPGHTFHPELSGPGGTGRIALPGSSNGAPLSAQGGGAGLATGGAGVAPGGTGVAAGTTAVPTGATALAAGNTAVPTDTTAAATVAFGAGDQASVASDPSQGQVATGPQPLYAANLGIYYEQVRYKDDTIGARLTSAPVPGKPAATLPLRKNDVIFMLNDQRFTKSDDLLKPFGQTTVGYIDALNNTSKAGMITLPPQGS